VLRIRDLARDRHGAEGLMLKHSESEYHSGRTAGGTGASIAIDGGRFAGWWKWKVDPYSIDAVLMYAQQGSGKRAGLYTDYTFGVWDPDPPGRLIAFAKAYSGLNDEEIRRVDAFIRNNAPERKGPVRMVKPELVFEIAFESIRASPRHKASIAVRFPRMARWRTDKAAADADTIASLKSLLKAVEAGDAAR
jgi:DNA ligase-1